LGFGGYPALGFMVQGSGSGVQGSGFGVQGSGVEVNFGGCYSPRQSTSEGCPPSGIRFSIFGVREEDLDGGFGVLGFEFWVSGFGFRVSISGSGVLQWCKRCPVAVRTVLGRARLWPARVSRIRSV